MSKDKLTIQELTDLLAQKAGVSKKTAEEFLKTFFLTIEGSLLANDFVKIKNFGTFKLQWNEARKSINVRTGEEIQLEGFYKVVFTPDSKLKELVNEPYAHLEPLQLDDDVVEIKTEPVEEVFSPLHIFTEQASEIKDILSEINALSAVHSTIKSDNQNEEIVEVNDEVVEVSEVSEEVSEVIDEVVEVVEVSEVSEEVSEVIDEVVEVSEVSDEVNDVNDEIIEDKGVSEEFSEVIDEVVEVSEVSDDVNEVNDEINEDKDVSDVVNEVNDEVVEVNEVSEEINEKIIEDKEVSEVNDEVKATIEEDVKYNNDLSDNEHIGSFEILDIAENIDEEENTELKLSDSLEYEFQTQSETEIQIESESNSEPINDGSIITSEIGTTEHSRQNDDDSLLVSNDNSIQEPLIPVAKPKKKKGCLIVFIVIFVLVIGSVVNYYLSSATRCWIKYSLLTEDNLDKVTNMSATTSDWFTDIKLWFEKKTVTVAKQKVAPKKAVIKTETPPTDTLQITQNKVISVNGKLVIDTVVPEPATTDNVEDLDALFDGPRVYKSFLGAEKISAGSRLILISLKYYGHRDFWVYIYEANQNLIEDPDKIPLGTELKIPKLDKRLIDKNNPRCIDKAKELHDLYVGR